ncbi:zinc finger CCHC domain-containing protein 9-like [Gigantopelta aegis]|uniref:zinc finger CCHC domain-containing protein 9-like n=1 Tax=Gigantopelta aegis TaxID=1735272 RepID=UPI001B889762|nr:zinc finger CCHC domain-containing protein 9-like [Gigantopelta aegis]
MTRFARSSDSNKKTPLDATKWEEMTKKKKFENKEKQKQTKTATPKQEHSGNDAPTTSNDSGNTVKKVKTKSSKTSPMKGDQSDGKKQFSNSSNWKGVKKGGQWTDAKERHIAKVFKKEYSREHRRMKRIQQKQAEKVCYNCRQPGHKMQDCVFLKESTDQGTGICFKCGSTEHSAGECSVKLPPGEYPFAKCFICGEMGHITRQCPDNPRGLYPKGGCCRICSSVDHFMKDCPERLAEQGIASETVGRISEEQSIDAEVSATEKIPKAKKKRPKVVKF